MVFTSNKPQPYSRGNGLASVLVTLCAFFVLAGCGKKETPSSSAAGSVQASRAVLDATTSRQQIEAGALEAACSLEVVIELPSEKRYDASSAVYTIPRDLSVKLIGFGTNKTAGTELGSFVTLLASASAVYGVAGQTQLERPDVAAFFKAPGMLKAGYQVDVDLKGVPPGDYAVYLKPTKGGTCPTHHTVRIQ
jgi:hypothetical protein